MSRYLTVTGPKASEKNNNAWSNFVDQVQFDGKGGLERAFRDIKCIRVVDRHKLEFETEEDVTIFLLKWT